MTTETPDTSSRITRLEYAIWGVRGDNGMVSEMREMRRNFDKWTTEERTHREEEATDRLSGQRAVILALLAAVIALIGTIASLVVVVTL